MTKQVHIHIHRTKARDAGEGEGKWITLSPSGTHVKIDKGGEITAGPKGMTGKKPSELSKGSKKEGEVGYEEQQKYGKYFSKGEMVTTGSGKHHEVISHVGPAVETTGGRFHPTKIRRVEKATSTGTTHVAKPDLSTGRDPEALAAHQRILAKRAAAPLKGSSGPATAKTESYSWGKLTKVGNVNESAIAHPKDRQGIAALADGDSYQYTDEQGKRWKVTRHGEQAAFYKANAAKPALVAPIGEFQDTPHDPTGMAHAGRPQGTAAVQARIDAKKAAASKPGPYYGAPLRGIGFSSPSEAQSPRKPENLPAPNPRKILESNKKSMEQLEKLVNNPGTLHSVKYDAKQTLANLRKQNEELERQIRGQESGMSKSKAQAPSGPAATKADWSKSNGDWTTAKKEGAAMFERALSSAKTGGDRTDAALKLKAEAAEQQKNGSYLGAVVLGLVNDYFDRLK